MWRQEPNRVQTVSADRAITIQTSVLPISPTEARKPSPRSSIRVAIGLRAIVWVSSSRWREEAMAPLVPASHCPCSSIRLIR